MSENQHGYKRGPLARKDPLPMPSPLTPADFREPCSLSVYQEYCRYWHIYCAARVSEVQAERVMLATILNTHTPANVTVYRWPDVAAEVHWIFEKPSDRLEDTFRRFIDAVKEYEKWKTGDAETVSRVEKQLQKS